MLTLWLEGRLCDPVLWTQCQLYGDKVLMGEAIKQLVPWQGLPAVAACSPWLCSTQLSCYKYTPLFYAHAQFTIHSKLGRAVEQVLKELQEHPPQLMPVSPHLNLTPALHLNHASSILSSVPSSTTPLHESITSLSSSASIFPPIGTMSSTQVSLFQSLLQHKIIEPLHSFHSISALCSTMSPMQNNLTTSLFPFNLSLLHCVSNAK